MPEEASVIPLADVLRAANELVCWSYSGLRTGRRARRHLLHPGIPAVHVAAQN